MMAAVRAYKVESMSAEDLLKYGVFWPYSDDAHGDAYFTLISPCRRASIVTIPADPPTTLSNPAIGNTRVQVIR